MVLQKWMHNIAVFQTSLSKDKKFVANMFSAFFCSAKDNNVIKNVILN